ncbi:MAG: acyl-CoA dehydrogenase family protein [Candidatus Thermoplasmatota archaeon]
MPFQLSDDERLMRDTVRQFAQSWGLANAAEADRFDRYPAQPMADAAALGLTALAARDGPGATAFVLALDEVAQVDPTLAACLAAHNGALAAAADHQVAAQLAAGEIAALLVAEEASGSDALHPGTVAKGIPLKLTGQKVWGINAVAARHLLVLAKEGDGLSLFALPADAAGVTLGANDPLMGLRAAGIRTVYLSNVAAPDAARIGAAGAGGHAVAAGRTWMTLGAAAALCGAVGGALAAATTFAQNRVQFGAPIATYQAVSDGLTTIEVQLAAARALVLQAAARIGEPDAAIWAARAKAFASEMAIPMTRQAIRVQGGTGFMREGGTERFARDARALQFVGETVQMQRDVLKRAMLPDVAFAAEP